MSISNDSGLYKYVKRMNKKLIMKIYNAPSPTPLFSYQEQYFKNLQHLFGTKIGSSFLLWLGMGYRPTYTHSLYLTL